MGNFLPNIQLIFKTYRKNRVQNSIILASVLFFALHSLYFIHVFSVNTIIGDEFNFLPFVKAFIIGDEFWKEDYFLQYDLHRLIIPNTLILISVALTKWNTIYLLYIGWSLIFISLIFLYLILKQTFPNSSGSISVAKINQNDADIATPRASVVPIVVNALILFNFFRLL